RIATVPIALTRRARSASSPERQRRGSQQSETSLRRHALLGTPLPDRRHRQRSALPWGANCPACQRSSRQARAPERLRRQVEPSAATRKPAPPVTRMRTLNCADPARSSDRRSVDSPELDPENETGG